MLSYGGDLGVVLDGTQWVPVLQCVPIRVVNVDIAFGNIMHEQRPEEVSSDDRVGPTLLRFDDAVE